LSRKIGSSYSRELALLAEHYPALKVDISDAEEMIRDTAYQLAKKAYKFDQGSNV
jgi:hypothetical protein